MAEFINTIDKFGDDAVIDSIIERSITEFHDNIVTTIASAAFLFCTALISVKLPAVTLIGTSALQGCSELLFVDIWQPARLEGYCFAVCPKFNGLILRSVDGVCILQGTAFVSTPFVSGAGYIYVPAVMVDSYKAATNWSTYANQFRALEDYTVDGTITGELDETKI